MTNLETPDLCARLDGLKRLCDHLEATQGDPENYHVLVGKIRTEMEMFQREVGAYAPKDTVVEAPIIAALD